jgi:hypothetical protein
MTAPAITIFLGAFLLFLVEPLTARRLLPWFGGSAMVWAVALVFFQTALLAGYLYAHLIVSRARRYGRPAHVGLLFLSLAFLPIGPADAPAAATFDPSITILRILASSLALPLVLLSATSPLIQGLASSSRVPERGEIYRLFALSNLGSLLGLWCYPFLLEPFSSLETQRWVWSLGFAAFVTFCAISVLRFRPVPARGPSRRPRERRSLLAPVLWLALSTAGSVLFMATGNQLTRNVASIPFLWVLPLSLYLGSFVVAFERERWYSRAFWGVLFLGSLVGILYMLTSGKEAALGLQLAVYSVNLLSGALLCHGELYRHRPPADALTGFYLAVAAGGALGGAFVALAAPAIFSGYWEYPLSLGLVYVASGASIVLAGEHDGVARGVLWFVGALALAVALGSYVRAGSEGAITSRRSFFGVLKVYDRELGPGLVERDLWNGPVAHGAQILDPAHRREPILYYGPETGVGIAFSYLSRLPRGLRIGVIGLGTGSLAAYGRASDRMRFYELNPQVVEVARGYFSYLDDSAADVSIVSGDARLSLARELRESGSNRFDLLVLDAFTGDAIPVHLLTREAFALYDRHLAPDGILAVHVSNLHFDLRPVVRAHAESMRAVALPVESDADASRHLYVTSWVLVTRNARFVESPALTRRTTPWQANVEYDAFGPGELAWTDDYSSVFRVLK